MGDASQNNLQLFDEQYRLETFEGHNFAIDNGTLAKAGFYYTHTGDFVKCYMCNLQIDAVNLKPDEDIIALHKEKKPDCKFAQNLNRSKKFASYDSLRFEKERLETFIEWPVKWLKPSDLARDGFYYLRTADHCACVFCRGIVGAWEEGDTPRGEHQRHFPHCPFIRGQPVGNIPITHGEILSKMSPSSPKLRNRHMVGIDVCGTPRHMPGSYAECSGPPKKEGANLDSMGLPQHSGPKRKDYLTYESRVASFVRWPELVKQKPGELAEAGFFYCGLSDHVRCFHCGNGLRNWESDDLPWNEHARWYPECNFVLVKKGQEFIDKVRRERPPYIRTPTSKPASSNASSKSVPVKNVITETELNPLMELDIIRAVLAMGFPQDKVRAALRRKLEQTGLPFFGLEPCIEAVLQYMEEETKRTLQQASSQEIGSEATAQQAAKMQSLEPGSPNQNESSLPSSSSAATLLPLPASSTATLASVSSAVTSSSPTVTSTGFSSSSSATISTPSTLAEVSSPVITTLPSPALVSSAFATTISTPTSVTRATSTSSVSSVSTSTSTATLPVYQETSRSLPLVPANNSSASPSLTTTDEEMETDETAAAGSLAQPMDVITEADEIMGIAEVALKPPISVSSSLSHIEMKIGQASGEKMLGEASTSGFAKKASTATKPQSSQELAEELERIRDIRMCKVCMDAEMDVVFLPCKHMVTCSLCALALAQCPICREDIKYTIKPILS